MERHGGDHTTRWTIQPSTRCEFVTYERRPAPRRPFGVLASGHLPSSFDHLAAPDEEAAAVLRMAAAPSESDPMIRASQTP
jgi:hypothetical protein